MAAPDFPALLATFLTTYLPRTRGCAVNPIRSYRDTFVLLIRYLATEHSTDPNEVGFADLTLDRIEMVGKWLGEEKAQARRALSTSDSPRSSPTCASPRPKHRN